MKLGLSVRRVGYLPQVENRKMQNISKAMQEQARNEHLTICKLREKVANGRGHLSLMERRAGRGHVRPLVQERGLQRLQRSGSLPRRLPRRLHRSRGAEFSRIAAYSAANTRVRRCVKISDLSTRKAGMLAGASPWRMAPHA